LVWAQPAVADKPNAIPAIPALVALLDLAGALVAIEARGCQNTIARDLVEAGAE
jgi:predicted transposase YbfD/YdcC